MARFIAELADTLPEREGTSDLGAFRPERKASRLRTLVRRYPFRVTKMASARFEIAAYLKRSPSRRLNIGADGNRPDGWLSIDLNPTFGVTYLDATRMLRLPSESFDAVLCEHMIEHVNDRSGFEICTQIHRVLKPGGVARLVTPDLDRLARLVLGSPDDERFLVLMRQWTGNPRLTSVDAINIAFRNHGHQYLYNRCALRDVLVAVGFASARIVETSASGYLHSVFRDVQGHATGTPEELNDLDAFAFEAER